MRKVKNITVCVSPEIYREARHLAAEYDATVSAFVAFLLPRLRVALERQRFPKGGPKPPAQPAPAHNVLVTHPPLPPTLAPISIATSPASEIAETAIPGCETVPANVTNKESAACSHLSGPGTAPVQL